MGTSSPEVEVTTKTKNGEKWCAVFFFGGLPSKRDGDVGLCGLEGGPCWLVFWKLLSFFLAWCVFFPVWVYFVVRKTVKQIQASYVFFWHGFDSWWCEFSIHSIRWTEMSFKRMPSPPGKGKKWSNKKKSTWNFRSNFRSSKTWAVFLMGSIFPSIPRKGWGIRGVIYSTPPHDQLTQIGGSSFDSSQWVVVWYCRCVHKCWDVWRNESDRPVVFCCFCKGNWWGGKLGKFENSKKFVDSWRMER